MSGIASRHSDQRGPYPASDRMGPGVGLSSRILGLLGDCRPSVSLAVAGRVAGVAAVVADSGSSGDERGRVRGKVLDRTRMDLGHRPYRLGHRTLVRVAHNDFAE